MLQLSHLAYQEDANRTVQPLSDCSSITESVGNLSQYRITATPQLSDCHDVINSEAFDPAAEFSRLERLDFPLLQPLFSRMFCVQLLQDHCRKI